MKLHCPISGLYYSAPYLHYAPYTTNQTHPSLTLSDKQLIQLLEQSDAPENVGLETTEQRVSYYLLHVAMLARLPVQFRVPLDFAGAYPHLVQYSQALRAAFIHTISVPNHALPGYAITSDNKDLYNLGEYLNIIQDARTARLRTHREQARMERIAERTKDLDRVIYAQSRHQTAQLSKLLPEWADISCGGFPTFPVTLSNGKTMSLSEAWKQAITMSILGEHHRIIGMYRKQDIDELIEHLEDNLELGTPYCSKLLRALRTSNGVIQDFLAPRKIRLKVSSSASASGGLDLGALEEMDSPTPAPTDPSKPKLSLKDLLAQRIKK